MYKKLKISVSKQQIPRSMYCCYDYNVFNASLCHKWCLNEADALDMTISTNNNNIHIVIMVLFSLYTLGNWETKMIHNIYVFFFCLSILVTEPMASCMLGRHSITDIYHILSPMRTNNLLLVTWLIRELSHELQLSYKFIVPSTGI